MDGVTTAIVVFVLAALIWPYIIRNRGQYYAALAAVLAIILLHAVALLINAQGFFRFAAVITAFLQIGGILLLVMAVGGLTVRDLGEQIADAYRSFQNPDRDKPTVIPLTGQQPKQKEEDAAPPRYTINDPTRPSPPPPPPGGQGGQSGSIPLE